jgi:predicted HicB family RNase H-like nuclease
MNNFCRLEKTMDTDKKMFTTRLGRETIKGLKILAAYQEKSVNRLLEEAIRDLLKKYDRKKQPS